MGAIRVDLLVTAGFAAAWAFLGVWLWRGADLWDRREVVEVLEGLQNPEAPISAGVRRR